MPKDDLEARIRKLEDIEEIKKLQAKYAYFIDTFKAEEVVKLMVKDIKAEYGLWGNYSGVSEMLAFLNGIIPVSPMMNHEVFTPLIEVDGDKATGTWYLLGPFVALRAEGKVATWIQGKYQNDYVRVKGEWKFSHIRFTPRLNSPHEDGWVKTPFM
jgi:hypothetical protein